MLCLYNLDGVDNAFRSELSNASVRNFPSDATLNAETGAAKCTRGSSGSARTSPLPSSYRERGGEGQTGADGVGWAGSGARAGGPAAQPPQARGRMVSRLGVGWRGRLGHPPRRILAWQ